MKDKFIGIFICILLFGKIIPIGINAIGIYDPLDCMNQDIIKMINQVNKSIVSKYLEDLVEFGSRYTGTESCNKAAQYLYDEFKKLNLDTSFEDWEYVEYRGQTQ